jgi:hypothetical protein
VQLAPFDAGSPSVAVNRGTGIVPDLLTPTDYQTLGTVLVREFGAQTGKQLVKTAQSIVSSIELGNFERQVDLGARLYQDLDLPLIIRASGAYLMGEGLRLQMPNQAPELRSAFLERAKEMYAISLELNRDNPRAMRGLGRISELEGGYSKALDLYTKARETVSAKLADRYSVEQQPMLFHELLRITRHRVNCLSGAQGGPAKSGTKLHTLELLLQETEELHNKYLGDFQFRPNWFDLEWFMGLVFIGKAWGTVGNVFRMSLCLIFALQHKRYLLGPQTTLTAIDRENLYWWLGAAEDCGDRLPDWKLNPLLQKLRLALDSHADLKVVQIVDELIHRGLPPNRRVV